MQIFKTPNFNFVRWRWQAIALSLVVIVAGLAMIWSRGGLKLGVEFEGGTIVIVQFEQPVRIDQVRNALGAMPGGETAVVQQYGEPSRREVMIRVAQVGAESGGQLSATADSVV